MKKITLFSLIVFVGLLNVIGNVFAQTTTTLAPPSNGGIGTGQTDTSCPYVYFSDGKTLQKISLSQYLQNFSKIGDNQINNPDATVYTYTVYVNGVKKDYPTSRKQQLDDFAKQYANIACPPTITDLQTLFLRIITITNSLVGLVILYVLVRASLLRATSQGDPEKIKKSNALITNAITGVIIIFTAYILLVFIGTRLLSNDACYRFSFIDSGKILFFFDQSDIAPVLDTGQSNCQAPT